MQKLISKEIRNFYINLILGHFIVMNLLNFCRQIRKRKTKVARSVEG